MSQRRTESKADDDSERSDRTADRSRGSNPVRGGVPAIQRAAGNQTLQALSAGAGARDASTISQPGDPAVSQPGDPVERAADRVADEVLDETGPQSAAGDGSETDAGLGRQSASAGDGTPAFASLSGNGRPLAPSVRSFFEPRFGRPLDDVRVHTGDRADRLTDALGATAFTTGRHIAFQSGAYRPEGPSGKQLLAHELTHVLQQTGLSGPTRSPDSATDESTEASTHAGQHADSRGQAGDTGPAPTSAADQVGPTIRQRSVPAVQRQTESSMSTAEAEELATHFRDISMTAIEELPTGVLIGMAEQKMQSFEHQSRPAFKRASAQTLLATYEELRSRAETAERAEDGTLLREVGPGEPVPWTPARPKRVSDIEVFRPVNYLRWTRTLSSEGDGGGGSPALESREYARPEPPTRVSESETSTESATPATQTEAVEQSGSGSAGQLEPASSAGERTTIGSALEAQDPPSGAPPRAVQADGESEIQRGLARLQQYTVGDLYRAVEEQLTDDSEGATAQTAESMENQELSLFDTVTELFYLTNRAYVIDRSGHITSGGWKYRFDKYSVTPGTVLFEATITMEFEGGGATTMPVQLRLGDQGASISTGSLEFSNPVEQELEVRPQITAVESSSAGLGVIVSSTLGSASPAAREWSWGNVRDALYASTDYLEWAVRQRLNRIQENPSSEAINLAIELGMDVILEAGQKITPVIGQAAAAVEAFEYANWFFDVAEVAAHAQSGDEIDLAAQAFARRIANEVITQGQVKGISKAGGSMRSAVSSGDGGGTSGGSTTPESSGETAGTGATTEGTTESAPEQAPSPESTTGAESTPDQPSGTERTPAAESTPEAAAGETTRTAEKGAADDKPRTRQSSTQPREYETIDDILTPDGNRFHIPDNPRAEAFLEMKYQQTKADTKAKNRWQWAKRQTSGEPRQVLINVIGPDFARKSKLPPGVPARPTVGDIDLDPLPTSRFTVRTDPLRGTEMQRQRELLAEYKRSSGTKRANLGNDYRDLILADVHPTTDPELVGKVTERPSPGRRRDLGEYEEITLEGISGGLTSHKHRQIWIDLFQNGKVKLIAPKLSSQAKTEIRLLAAAAEQQLGETVSVEIRETVDNL